MKRIYSQAQKREAKVIPPFRFAIVEEGIYRGAYPTLKNFRCLRRLRLKTLLSLVPEPPTSDLVEFCEHQGIKNVHFTVAKMTDNITISAEVVKLILELMIDQDNLPLYLHCLDGTNLTGICIMALRKLQHWDLAALVSEFTRFTHNQEISSDESQFIERLKLELQLPMTLPKWLFGGVRISKHVNPMIKFQTVEETKEDKKEQRREHRHRKDAEDTFEDEEEEEDGSDNIDNFSMELHALALEGLTASLPRRQMKAYVAVL
eukprot:GILK01009897.1.p1 GENE.GILK01009897.1~~GILK01009897.1.p1  ORF type:complete len:262 (+),score=31.94 GILK01009897.1:75-860(+)